MWPSNAMPHAAIRASTRWPYSCTMANSRGASSAAMLSRRGDPDSSLSGIIPDGSGMNWSHR